MALIKCPECGRENVSDSAENCPSCGYGIKAHFDKLKESVYVLLLDPSDYAKSVNTLLSHIVFSDGIANGTNGKVNNKDDYSYWVKDGHLFTQRQGYKVNEYIIDKECLINTKSIYSGDLPTGGYMNAECICPCIYDPALTTHIIFNDNGTFVEQTDGKVGTSGIYMHKGNLIAMKSKDSVNKSYCYYIYKNQYCKTTYAKVGSTILEKAKSLCIELDNKPYISRSVGVPEIKEKTNESNGIICPYCKSTNCSKISTVSRGFSFSLFGFGSSKVGKQWHCNSCKSNF